MRRTSSPSTPASASTTRRARWCRRTLRRAREVAQPFLERCVDDPVWEQYDVIGFTSTFTQHAASLALARRLKERFPDKTLIFGGANCEGAMGVAVQRLFPFVDYVCSGEADLSLPALIDALAEGRDPSGIPGVISAQNGGRGAAPSPERVRNLDDLPVPDFGDYFAEVPVELAARRGVLMETSRGCWWGREAPLHLLRSQRHEHDLPEQVGRPGAGRARHPAGALPPASFIEMVDNILDMHYFQDLLPQLRARETPAGPVLRDQGQPRQGAGLHLASLGRRGHPARDGEASADVLRLMRKGTTALQNIQFLRWCKEAGMKVYWNLIYGFRAGEDPEATAGWGVSSTS